MSKSKQFDEKENRYSGYFEQTKPHFDLKQFVYNKREGKICGRSKSSWGKENVD